MSQNTERFHLDANGAVVLDEIAIQPQGQDDMEPLEGAHGTVQENEPGPEQQQSDKRSVMSKTSVGSVASLTTGDVERRMLENNVDPTTDSAIQEIEEEHEVMEKRL